MSSSDSASAAPSMARERNKFQSPPPPPDSMTPPPSSSHAPQYPARTPTPTNSHLSSPPPTVKTAAARHRASLLDADSTAQSSDNESAGGVDQLRSMLATAQEECRAAKTSAAHYRFQFELQSLEYSESLNRMKVELEMTAREVDVLQRTRVESPSSSSHQAVLEWKNRCHLLELENESLRSRLVDAKALIMEREGARNEETDRLRQRIRDNRVHMNRLRQAGAFVGETSPEAYPASSRRDNQYSSSRNTRGDEPFHSLLLAGQVLSQEAASTPSTPLGSRQRGEAHHRAQQTLASLPSTPYRSAPRVQAPYYNIPPASAPMRNTRRRESRDSTISASDMGHNDDEAERVPDSEGEYETEREFDPEAHTSQASQEAASMLRKSVSYRKSQHPQNRHFRSPPAKATDVAAAPRPPSGGQMYGYQIAKPGASGQESIKRRFYDDGPGADADAASTKARKKGKTSSTSTAGIGLGLDMGTWVGAK